MMNGYKTAVAMAVALITGVATLLGVDITGELDQGAILAIITALGGFYMRHVSTGKAGWRK